MNLIIDANYVAHKVRYGMRGIELSHESLNVEVIFGFLKQLLMVCKKFRSMNNPIFCWDSRISFRKRIYPKYKEKRMNKVWTDEEKEFNRVTMDQFKVLRMHVLPRMGFVNNFFQSGYEGDDVIASVVLNNPDKEFLLITSDQDMYQLLSDNMKIYSLHSRQIMDEKKFTIKYNIEPKDWVMAKAIGGCDTDEVAGIKGVSDPAKSDKSLALAYIRGDLKKGKAFDRIESAKGQKIIKRNLPLVRLPFEGTKKFELKKSSLWRKSFRDTFEQYGLQSMLKENNFRLWETILNLN